MDSYDAVRDMRIEERGISYRRVPTQPPYRSRYGRLVDNAKMEMDRRSSVGGDDPIAIGGE